MLTWYNAYPADVEKHGGKPRETRHVIDSRDISAEFIFVQLMLMQEEIDELKMKRR
jgi:hypothetical protein